MIRYGIDVKKDRGEKLAAAVEEALNILGGPTMSYVPAIANKERKVLIERASKILIGAWKEFRGFSRRK